MEGKAILDELIMEREMLLADHIAFVATERRRKERANARRRTRRHSRGFLPKRVYVWDGSALRQPPYGTRLAALKTHVRAVLVDEILKRRALVETRGIDFVLAELTTLPIYDLVCIARPSEKAAVEALAREMRTQWAKRYATKEKRQDPRPASAPWSEEAVREYLEQELLLCRAGLRALAKTPQHWTEARAFDRALAECDVLERLIYSNHLSSREHFLRVCEIFRCEAAAPPICHTKEIYAQAWRDTLDRYKHELSTRFGAGEK